MLHALGMITKDRNRIEFKCDFVHSLRSPSLWINDQPPASQLDLFDHSSEVIADLKSRVHEAKQRIARKKTLAREFMVQNASLRHLVFRNFRHELQSGQAVQNKVPVPFILVAYPRDSYVDVQMSEDGGVTMNSDSPPVLQNENHVVSHMSLLKEREHENIIDLNDNVEDEIRQMMDDVRMDDIDIEQANLELEGQQLKQERMQIEEEMYQVNRTPERAEILNISSPYKAVERTPLKQDYLSPYLNMCYQISPLTSNFMSPYRKELTPLKPFSGFQTPYKDSSN